MSDAAIRFLRITKTNVIEQQLSLALPPGIVHGGRIKDRQNFVAALYELKKQIAPEGKKLVEAVLSISTEGVYAQTIFLPSVASVNIEEAARLNIQMLSPISLASAYYDWHQIKRKEGGYSDQIEILSAVVNKDVINEFSEAFRESGFAILAIDFTALSLARLLRRLTVDASKVEPVIFLFISSDGVELFITKAGELYFSYFHSWDTIRGASASFTLSHFREFVAKEISRVANFYQTRYSVTISSVLVVAPGLYEEVEIAMREGLPSMRAQPFVIKEYEHMPSYWYVALGAALRARVPRYQDQELSITSLNTREEYAFLRAVTFMRLWRNLAWVAGSFLVLVYAATLIFVIRYGARVKESITQRVRSPVDEAQLQALQSEAASFNLIIDFAKSIEGSLVDWSPVLRRFHELAGAGVSIQKISVAKAGDAVVVAAAVTPDAALAFRDALIDQRGISNLKLPVTDLIGKSYFTMTFHVDVGAFGRD